MDDRTPAPDDLVTEEGVNEQGTDAELAGRDPGGADGHGRGGTDAPGLAAAGDERLLDGAPEPNEPG